MSEDLRFFSNCILVDGYNRDVIYDLQKSKYHIIPKGVKEFMTNEDVRNNPEYCDIFASYLEFFEKHDLINYLDDDDSEFPELDLVFNYPSLVKNIVCRFSFEYDFDFKIFHSLRPNLIILLFETIITDSLLESILQQLELFESIKQIKMIAKYNGESEFVNILQKSSKLSDYVTYCADFESDFKINQINVSKVVNSVLGNAMLNYFENFMVNISVYSESVNHHTYFNQSLFIEHDGSIKNTLENQESHGNMHDLIDTNALKAIVESQQFQKYWQITKEETEVCSVCEFRRMCVDNRIPFQKDNSRWFHKTECDYNPYISKWSHEEGYKSLAECGVISNENEFSIDHEKIAEINKELWGDD